MTNPNEPKLYRDWDDPKLTAGENAYVHDLALDLAEKMRIDYPTLSSEEKARKFKVEDFNANVVGPIRAQFGVDFPESRINIMVKSAWEKFNHLMKLQEEERMAISEKESLSYEHRNEDRFVRAMPAPSINPTPGSDLMDGNIARAAKGFWHKLDRATRLYSASAYDLKPGSKADMAEGVRQTLNVAGKQSDVGYNAQQRLVLAETIAELEGIIARAESSVEANETLISKIKAKLDSIKSGVKESDIYLDDLSYTLKIEQFEEDQASGGKMDKVAGKVLGGAARMIFSGKNSEKYAKAFADQTKVEQEIIDLEIEVKGMLGVDLEANPVEGNLNRNGVFDGNRLKLEIFQDRHSRLSERLASLAEITASAVNATSAKNDRKKDEIYSFEMAKLGHQASLRKIKSAEKKWAIQSPAEMERIFWLYFGDKITMIRDWQKNLPMVNRMGQVAYRSHTTAISRTYQELRDDIRRFEEVENVTGMMGLLDQELGTIKVNGSLINPKARRARADLEAVQLELRELRQRRLDFFDAFPDAADLMPSDVTQVEFKYKRKPPVAATTAPASTPAPSPAPSPAADAGKTPGKVDSDDSAKPAVDSSAAPKVDTGAKPGIDGGVKVAVDGGITPDVDGGVKVAVDGGVTPGVDGGVKVAVDGGITPDVDGGVKATPDAVASPDTAKDTAAKTDAPAIALPKGPEPTPAAIVLATGTDIKAVDKPDAAADAPKEDVKAAEVKASTPEAPKFIDITRLSEYIERIRPRTTMIIGDLNGSYDAFLKNTVSLKLRHGSDMWRGGNRRIITLGDVLADRTAEGLKIFSDIATLRTQAAVEKGTIEQICGNHEYFLACVLTERKVNGKDDDGKDSLNALHNCMIHDWQGFGVLEFISKFSKFGNGFNGDLNALRAEIDRRVAKEGLMWMQDLPGEMRKNMQTSDSGRKILEEMCSMKLVILDGDTLIFHTEPSLEILKELTDGDNLKEIVDSINKEFQEGLRALLFEEGTLRAENRYPHLSSTFLDTDNRDFRYKLEIPEIKEKMAKLWSMGAKRIVHGHTPKKPGIEPVYTTESGVTIANVDFGTGGKTGSDPESRSVAALDRRGKFAIGRKEVEAVPAFDSNKQIARGLAEDWIGDIFSLTDHDGELLADKLVFAAKIQDRVDFEEKLTLDMKKFLTAMARMKKKGSEEMMLTPKAEDLVHMINFYKEWVEAVEKTVSLDDKIKEIAGYDMASREEIFEKWRKEHGNKEAPLASAAPADVAADTAKKATDAAAVDDVKPEPVKTEPAAEEKPVAKEPLTQDDQEKLALERFPKLLGLEAGKIGLVTAFLDNLKATAPKTYLSIISNLNKFPEAITFLFTLTKDGEKVPNLKKLRPFNASEMKIGNRGSNILTAILTKTDTLAIVSQKLTKPADELALELAKFKNLKVWFDGLK